MSIVDLMSEKSEELIFNEKEDIQSSEETEALPLKKKGEKKKNSKKKSEELVKDDEKDDDDAISEKSEKEDDDKNSEESLRKMKVLELKKMCKTAELKNYSKLKKDELISMLLSK